MKLKNWMSELVCWNELKKKESSQKVKPGWINLKTILDKFEQKKLGSFSIIMLNDPFLSILFFNFVVFVNDVVSNYYKCISIMLK